MAIASASLATRAGAERLKTIEVVDRTDTRETINDPSISHPDERCSMAQYLELSAPGSPGKSLFIHYSQIKSVSFKGGKDGIGATVLLADGEAVRGTLPDRKMTIIGRGELGDITYDDVSKIKTVTFLRFSTYDVSGEEVTITGEAAASRWREKREKRSAWRMSDGKGETLAGGFAVMDCDTREDPFSFVKKGLIYVPRKLRVAAPLEAIPVQRGVSRISLAADGFESVEFTGRAIDGRPEMVLKKSNGKKYTVSLLLSGVDKDDMLLLRRPYGWEGVPLLPLRKITLRAAKAPASPKAAPAAPAAAERPAPARKAKPGGKKKVEEKAKATEEAKKKEEVSAAKDAPAKPPAPAPKVKAPERKVSGKGTAGSIESVVSAKGLIRKGSTITVKNDSGGPALVKVMGPTKRLFRVRDGKGRTIKVPAGRYRVLVRYGSGPDSYAYAEGDPFDVVETDTEYSATTITLHGKEGGNYGSRPLTPEAFKKGRGAGGAPK